MDALMKVWQLMKVSPVLAEFLEGILVGWGSNAEEIARLQKIGPRLVRTQTDAEGERKRLDVLLDRIDSLLEPRLPEIVEFISDYEDPPPRKREIELWPGQGLDIRTAPMRDSDVILATWHSRDGARYKYPEISIGRVCMQLDRRIESYKAVKRDHALHDQAIHYGYLASAIACRTAAADTQSGIIGQMSLHILAPGDREQTFELELSVLDEMVRAF